MEAAPLAQAWLAAVTALLALPLGCLAWMALGPVVGGGWAASLAPSLRAVIATLPVGVLLFLPLLVWLPETFPWAAAPEQLAGPKRLWFASGFFTLRALLLLGSWLALAWWLTRGAQPSTAAGVTALAVLAPTVTIAAVDWTQSFEPGFNSSIWGLMAMARHAGAGLAGAALLLLRRREDEPPAWLGGLLLAAAIPWAYLAYMQYLVVWSTDLPAEATWYLRRTSGGWRWWPWAVAVLHLLVPLVLLLPSRLRRRGGAVLASAVAILAASVAETLWLVLPAGNAAPPVAEVAAALGLAGLLYGAAVIWAARRR